MKHIIDPILLQFLNMICIKQPTQNEIDMYFQVVIFQKQNYYCIDCNTIILCLDREDMNKYNDLLIHKILHANEMFYVIMNTNVTNIEHVENWLQDLKFHHRKYIVIRAIIMVPKKTFFI